MKTAPRFRLSSWVKPKKYPCVHRSFWFDRELTYCSPCKDEHMTEFCNRCDKSKCIIEAALA